ncbi:MAG: hypothetical protein FWE26_01455 [Coriobacteriia bacterium]|nr:hypothetical protein [Coriobacteriia bacterium]MCL2870288.1 hypothetical protein [Coriobacteriia bacterium]
MIAVLIFVPKALKKRAQENESSQVPNDFMPSELTHSFIAIMITFVFASITIYAYYLIVSDYLVWFSVAMLFWYLLGFTAYALQKIVNERKTSDK